MKLFCLLFLILVLWQSNGLFLHAQEKRISEISFEAITAITPRIDSSAFSISEVVVIREGSSSVFAYIRQFIQSQWVFEYNNKFRLEAIMSIHQHTGFIGSC